MRFIKIFSLHMVILSTMLLWQNCGPIHYAAPESIFSSQLDINKLHSIKESTPLYSVFPLESLGIKTDLIFMVDSNEIETEGVKSIIWDHSLPAGIFCTQSSETSIYLVTLNCDSAGELQLLLIIDYEDGTQVSFEATVTILENAVPPPKDPINNPPTSLDGSALYSLQCVGCHAQNSKNGSNTQSIQNAINGNVGGMGSLSSLSSAEVQAIADYLNK